VWGTREKHKKWKSEATNYVLGYTKGKYGLMSLAGVRKIHRKSRQLQKRQQGRPKNLDALQEIIGVRDESDPGKAFLFFRGL